MRGGRCGPINGTMDSAAIDIQYVRLDDDVREIVNDLAARRIGAFLTSSTTYSGNE